MRLLSSDDFLEAVDGGKLEEFPFMFQPSYLRLNPDIRFLKDERMCAPVRVSTHKIYRAIQFLFPPLCLDASRPEENDETVFCEAAIAFIRSNHVAHRIVQPPTYALFNRYPRGSVHIPFGTFRISLTGRSDDELLAAMRPNYRNEVRQARKLGLTIRTGIPEVESFHSLHVATMTRGDGFPVSASQLKRELEHCPESTLLANVYLRDTLLGGVYLAYTRAGAYYLHGASLEGAEAAGAGKYLHYLMMIRMRDLKVRYYDFVGARISGNLPARIQTIQDFKRRFGGELVRGYLWKKDTSAGVAAMADAALKLKCALKGTKFPEDIIDQVRRSESV